MQNTGPTGPTGKYNHDHIGPTHTPSNMNKTIFVEDRVNGITYSEKSISEMTPSEFMKKQEDEFQQYIIKAFSLVIGYVFLTCILGAIISFGGIWWAIALSYIIAITGGAVTCVQKYESKEFLEKVFEKEYKERKKNANN